MTKEEAAKLAEPIVKAVVDLVAERRYSELGGIAETEPLFLADIEEMVEGHLEINEYTHMDKFDVPCNFDPQYMNGKKYHQLSAYVYNDGSGFAVDYDLTTDGERNDLTLQMDFRFTENGGLTAKIIDFHIL